MKRCRTLVFSLLFVLLGLSLMLGSPGQVNAGGTLTTSEWKDVACSIDRYIQSQHVAGPDTLSLGDGDNEYGFVYPTTQYTSSVDSNSDGIFCGVGDDMANRPVLVDNLLSTLSTLIPGTSIRNTWNISSTTTGGMSPAAIAGVKAKVNAHREAGFSADISIY